MQRSARLPLWGVGRPCEGTRFCACPHGKAWVRSPINGPFEGKDWSFRSSPMNGSDEAEVTTKRRSLKKNFVRSTPPVPRLVPQPFHLHPQPLSFLSTSSHHPTLHQHILKSSLLSIALQLCHRKEAPASEKQLEVVHSQK